MTQEGSDIEAVRAANLAFYTAFSSLDIQQMAGVWEHTERTLCVHPGWRALSGWQAIGESWESIFNNTTLMHFNITGARVVIEGDSAWVCCTENVTTVLDGRAAEFAIQATNVFVRTEGRWRLVHHHGSQLMG